jgi:ABC-2 type transport system ATP-binding protein
MGVIGPNGAGKTTLLEIVATLQLPTSGSATIGGLDLVTHAEGVKRLVGYCPSDSESFYPRLTGRANLEFFAALDGLSPREARSRVEAVLGTIRAAELADARFQQCSAGMKQKLGLARALLADPPILLLDEPTRSLDPGSQRQFHVLLRHTLADRSGKTILIVTHSLREAERVCDRVALLRDGEIAVVAPARQVCGDLRFELPFHGAQPAPLAAEA